MRFEQWVQGCYSRGALRLVSSLTNDPMVHNTPGEWAITRMMASLQRGQSLAGRAAASTEVSPIVLRSSSLLRERLAVPLKHHQQHIFAVNVGLDSGLDLAILCQNILELRLDLFDLRNPCS